MPLAEGNSQNLASIEMLEKKSQAQKSSGESSKPKEPLYCKSRAARAGPSGDMNGHTACSCKGKCQGGTCSLQVQLLPGLAAGAPAIPTAAAHPT